VSIGHKSLSEQCSHQLFEYEMQRNAMSITEAGLRPLFLAHSKN